MYMCVFLCVNKDNLCDKVCIVGGVRCCVTALLGGLLDPLYRILAVNGVELVYDASCPVIGQTGCHKRDTPTVFHIPTSGDNKFHMVF